MGGRGAGYKRSGNTIPQGQGVRAPDDTPLMQPDDNNQPQATSDGTQEIRDPKELLKFFENADDAACNAMLAQWRAEPVDGRQEDNDMSRFFNYIGWTDNTPTVLDETSYQQALAAA